MIFKHRRKAPTRRSWPVSDRGLVRSSNQDEVYADDELKLWLVADGMGGHAGGGWASRLARDAVRDGIASGLELTESIARAHHAIRRSQQENPELAEMGTTVVAVHELNGRCEIRWVGDSRVYRFDRSSGDLELFTRDHNLAQLLVDSGDLEPEQAAGRPERHILTNCLGQPGEAPDIGSAELEWQPADWLLLCSDGLTGEVDETLLAELLERDPDPESAARLLVETALAAGGRDNVSVVIVTAPEGISA